MIRDAFDAYDYLVVTHLPSFYKVNLYNALAKHLRICVVFVGATSAGRTADFVVADAAFDHVFLNTGPFETGDRFAGCRRIARIIRRTRYDRLLVNGWDLPEFWAAAAASRRSRNCLALESTLRDSAPDGAKGAVKRLFLSRMSEVFASGAAHVALLDALGWRRATRVTSGVGIINKPARTPRPAREYSRRFLFVGRLVPEKNLAALLAAFSRLPEHTLTVVGNGPEGEALRAAATANVTFRAHVDNAVIGDVLDAHDCLVLPSVREPWGLVVEEAMYRGVPALVSRHCGAAELIRHGVNGWLFDPDTPSALEDAVRAVNSGNLTAADGKVFIDAKDERQVATYVSAAGMGTGAAAVAV